jgi:diguanylate cyclase (GGDEF)-like protein/PAS domain S-box-containing protein
MDDCASPTAVNEFGQFVITHEEWLMERLLAYAKQQGYTKYTSSLCEVWQQSVSGLNRALLKALDSFGLDGMELTPDETFAGDPVSVFAVEESRRHRERGVALPLFLGLFKYYRRTWLDLIREEGDGLACREQCRNAAARFFDRLEVAFCTDWAAVDEQGRLDELSHKSLLMVNEKNRFLTLFESLLSPVFLLDDDLGIEFMNLAAARHLGVADSPGELYYARRPGAQIGKDSPARVPLERYAPWLAEVMGNACSLNGGVRKGCDFDITAQTARGMRNFAVSVSRMSDISDRFSGLALVLNDITRHVGLERQLERERNRAASYLDIIGSIVLALDASGSITLLNQAGLAALGYESEEVLGQDWFDLAIPEEERDKVRKFFQSAISQGASFDEDYVNHIVTRTGQWRLVSWKSHLLTNEDGVPVGALSAGNDITAQAEADRLLREREKLYRAFFENNHAVMLLQNPRNGNIVDANPAASAFYGYSIEKMRKMNFADLNVLSEVEIFQAMTEARAEHRTNFLSRHRLANGDVRDVEVYSGPILVQGRQLLYSLVHDVTERVRLERELERMATTDALTGADNRHRFFQRAGEEMTRALRYDHPLCVLMLDIDHFKQINDSYGHQSGDAVLKALVSLSLNTLRETDAFGRLGGEEFAAILTETDLESGLVVAERLRDSLEKCTVRDMGGNELHFTVSIGVVERRVTDADMETIIRRADEALYRAKDKGRNRVEKG